jgi:hypothetical protein
MARTTRNGSAERPRIRAVDLDRVLASTRWFDKAAAAVGPRVVPGDITGALSIPQGDAQKVLAGVVRLVADLPVGTTAVVVWHQSVDELWVDTSSVTIACDPGLVTMSLTVSCDQVRRPVTLAVPFAVGTSTIPTGLLMTTFDQLAGPDVVVAAWSEAVTAFCWESLVEVARAVCTRLGKDRTGKTLVPGGLGADKGRLLIQPMARVPGRTMR